MMRSAIALATLAASVVAESSSCPATTTITETKTTPTEVQVWVTKPYNTPLETYTQTPTTFITTGTTTVTEETAYVSTCAESLTRSLEYTTTVYTGDWTSSSLRPSTSCAPKQKFIYKYPGTKTGTYTDYIYAETITAPAVTKETQATEWVTSATTTETVDGFCGTFTTEIIGTASSTVTQELKCAPTNLIGTDGENHSRSGYRGLPEDGIAWYGNSARSPPGWEDNTGAHKDASACCQACQEDPLCVASIFSGTSSTYPKPTLPDCQFYYGSSFDGDRDANETCGLGFTIFKGDKQIAQSGSCGYIAENVYADGLCPEGMTPSECDAWGVGGFVREDDE